MMAPKALVAKVVRELDQTFLVQEPPMLEVAAVETMALAIHLLVELAVAVLAQILAQV
jgi:hypothetical protein